jgi:hypothetical protein
MLPVQTIADEVNHKAGLRQTLLEILADFAFIFDNQ